jgi:hypothetical protein
MGERSLVETQPVVQAGAGCQSTAGYYFAYMAGYATRISEAWSFAAAI